MFKCKECGTEYNTKPDYCDCGNDEFEEIHAEIKQEEQNPPANNNYKQETVEIEEPEKEIAKNKKIFNLSSLIIFILCIISGLCILFFVGNPKQNEDTKQSSSQKDINTQNLNIPSIESIWISSTEGIINNEKTAKQTTSVNTAEQKPIKNEIANISKPQPIQNVPINVQPAATQPKTAQNTKSSQPAKQQQSAKNTVSSKLKQTFSGNNTTSPQTPAIPKNTQAIANQPKTASVSTTAQSPPAKNQTTNSTNTQKTVPAQNTAQNSTANITPSTTLRPQAAIDTQALKKELENYKVGLRNTIGRKIEFANVIGDGNCTVSFKIASNGQLINRAFAKQSSNITLNDAVYKAVMATPNYNPPPSGYENETLNLNIKFYNGNFTVSLN